MSRNLESDQGLAWKDFGISLEEVTHTEEDSLCNKLPENEKKYALFTDCSATIIGKDQRSSLLQQNAEGEGESSEFAEVKAIQLALDIAEWEKWPTF